jgi:Flagella basal body rod protein.
MIRALYTSASGMRVHQNEINNIGNNIANVNTIGYKKSIPALKKIYMT